MSCSLLIFLHIVACYPTGKPLFFFMYFFHLIPPPFYHIWWCFLNFSCLTLENKTKWKIWEFHFSRTFIFRFFSFSSQFSLSTFLPKFHSLSPSFSQVFHQIIIIIIIMRAVTTWSHTLQISIMPNLQLFWKYLLVMSSKRLC